MKKMQSSYHQQMRCFNHLCKAEPAREVVKDKKGKRPSKPREDAEETEQRVLGLPAPPQRRSGLVSTRFTPTSQAGNTSTLQAKAKGQAQLSPSLLTTQPVKMRNKVQCYLNLILNCKNWLQYLWKHGSSIHFELPKEHRPQESSFFSSIIPTGWLLSNVFKFQKDRSSCHDSVVSGSDQEL